MRGAVQTPWLMCYLVLKGGPWDNDSARHGLGAWVYVGRKVALEELPEQVPESKSAVRLWRYSFADSADDECD